MKEKYDPDKRVIHYEIKECPCCGKIIEEKIVKIEYNGTVEHR